jgi:hypothetical protein
MATRNRKPVRKKLDLQDSPDDIKHLQPEETTMDLPDVDDIPGQEHVRPMPAGEMADTTISSDDEEGKGVLDDEEEISDDISNVSKSERDLLRQSADSMATEDDLALERAKLDRTDNEGVPLNERTDLSGQELDLPGEDENPSEDDEENNPTSLNQDKEDNINTQG